MNSHSDKPQTLSDKPQTLSDIQSAKVSLEKDSSRPYEGSSQPFGSLFAMEKRLIFDGACELQVPSHWLDCSLIRQIPDNQYCWVVPGRTKETPEETANFSQDSSTFYFSQDSSTFYFPQDSSLILELLESAPSIHSHFDDLLQAEFEITKQNVSVLYDSTTAASNHHQILGSLLHLSKFNKTTKDSVILILGLVSLDAVDCNVLLSLNLPIADIQIQNDQEMNRFVAYYVSVMQSILDSFKVNDFSLFA